MSSTRLRTLSHQYFIRAPPNDVFRAISDAQWLTRWLCDRAEMDHRSSGKYLLAWTDGPTHTGTVVDFSPGKRVVLTWAWPDVALDGTLFSLSVEPKEEGTLLQIEHSGFPRIERWTDLYGGAEWGWTYFAMNLKSVLEAGRDLRSRHDG